MTKNSNETSFARQKSEYSEALEQVDLNILQAHINSGRADTLPDKLVIYLELLEVVRAMYNKYETKSFILNMLMSPVYGLTRKRATQLFYDALNFFYADNQVKQKAWENIYADHMDRLAYYAIARDEIENARRCFKDAALFRNVGRDEKTTVPDEMKQRPVVIYTMDPEKVGLPVANRKQLAEFIDNIPEISERERVRIKRDGGVTEVKLFDDFIDEENQSQ